MFNPMSSLNTVKELAPNTTIKIPVAYFISFVILIVSLGIGWGSYKTAFDNQTSAIMERKTQEASLEKEVQDLRYDMGQLRQALEDLKDSIDKKK